jgi:riboflavin kinase/FMN adenylyltransferase
MRVLESLDGVTFNRPILTLGTYDGVHLGHQRIIEEMVQKGKEMGCETVLFTFNPHPRMVLFPENHEVRLIDTVPEKLKKLEALGLDTVVLFPFTIPFSKMTAHEFVELILVNKIHVSQVYVGHDHHFGKDRSGNFEELVHLGNQFGFTVHQTTAFDWNETIVSSTKIRKALFEGDVVFANQLMGKPFCITGNVISGNQLGRTIGFPTANLAVDSSEKILPKIGVYAVRVYWQNNWYHGVMNIGNKPTVQISNQLSLEVFIFDFNATIYGEQLTVEFHDRLRGEQRFDSIEQLTEQLHKDAEMARHMLRYIEC